METVYVLAGSVLIFVALRDIFHTLLHPEGKGALSETIPRLVWRAFRLPAGARASALDLAGPAAFLAVITSWAALMLVGWALVYLPHLPGGFRFAPGFGPAAGGSFGEALYLSFVTLTTLGFGDVTPTSAWLRVMVPLEALFGFGIFTASVSWLLSLYPALSRRRSLAHRVTLLTEAEQSAGAPLSGAGDETAARVLREAGDALATIRGDLSQFPIAYYFRDPDERASLPVALARLEVLAREHLDSGHAPPVRLGAAVLRAALEDLAVKLGERFPHLRAGSGGGVLAAYARDHARRPGHGKVGAG